MDAIVYDKVGKEAEKVRDALYGIYPKATITDAAIASFDDGADGIPVKALTVGVEPVQNLHGYDSPWPAGGGKNKFGCADGTYVVGTTRTINVNNHVWEYIINTAAATSTVFLPEATVTAMGIQKLQPGTYTFSIASNALEPVLIASAVLNLSDGQAVTNGNSFTVSEETSVVSITTTGYGAYAAGTYSCNIQIELGSTATAWTPYSNICPISGWTGAEIYHEAEYDADANPTISVTFPSEAGTVYGGTLTLNPDRTGTLVVDKGLADLSNFTWGKSSSYQNVFVATSNMPTKWPVSKGDSTIADLRSNSYGATSWINLISSNEQDAKISYRSSGSGKGCAIRDSTLSTYYDNFDLTAFKAAISGRTVLYPLAIHLNYQLTAEQVSGILTTLYGQNNIWADTGNIEKLTYRADLGRYIDSHITTAVANALNA